MITNQKQPKVTGYAMAEATQPMYSRNEEVGYAANPKAPILMEIEMVNKQISVLFDIYEQLEQRLSAYTVCAPQDGVMEEEKRYRPNSAIGEKLYCIHTSLIALDFKLRDLLSRIEN